MCVAHAAIKKGASRCRLGELTARHNIRMHNLKHEIAATAARMVVEEGLEYGPAKRRAVKQMGLLSRTALPDSDTVHAAVEEYITIFCADTQPIELRALRVLALEWMERLQAFRPYLGGAVWRGTATRHSDIYLQLFCDDSKSTEIALIDHGVRYDVRAVPGLQGGLVDALSVQARCLPLGEVVGVHLLVNDADDVRGALHRDANGRRPRGDMAAVQRLLEEPSHG